jgi:hypothetical protein
MSEAFPVAEATTTPDRFKVDLSTEEMTSAFASAPIFAKKGTVRAD